MQLNCIPASESLRSLNELEGFISLEIAPVASNEDETGETHCEVTEPLTGNFWTIYGRDREGLATALHDEEDPQALAEALLFVTTELGLLVSYFDTKRGRSQVYSLRDLADHLTWVLHDELDEGVVFDDHELCALRDAICEISGY